MPLAPGTRLGPYEILSALGAGGMGEVYKAVDTRLGRTVAIKTLSAGHADRFRQEARAIAALSHPHICVLHDIGPDYLVMEYVDGKPLTGPLPLEDTLRVAGEVVEALEAAHAKGILQGPDGGRLCECRADGKGRAAARVHERRIVRRSDRVLYLLPFSGRD